MYASMLVVALTQVLSNAAVAVDWNNDYAKAMKSASSAGKPLAIFIGSGTSGWQAVGSGTISGEATKLLKERYVCVYVDASTAAGKELANDFEARRLPTLVLSDKTAKYQAYKHAGALGQSDLAQVLERYVAYEVPAAQIQRASYYYGPSTSTPVYSRSFGGGGC